MSPEYVDGLKRERAHYQTQGLAERVAQVTAELVRVGAEKPTQQERAVRPGPVETRRRR
jgi:hypothetical protein